MLGRVWLGVALALGLLAVANGLFMLSSPLSWYHAIPGVSAEGPFNQHFIRDIGLAFLLVGLSFLAGVRRPELRSGVWLSATFWLSGHALFHLWEVAQGMKDASTLMRDFPAVTLPALIGLALTWWAWKSGPPIAGPLSGHAMPASD